MFMDYHPQHYTIKVLKSLAVYGLSSATKTIKVSLCLSVSLRLCLSLSLSLCVCLSLSLSVYLSVRLFFCPSVLLFLCLFMSLFLCLSASTSACLSVCLSLSPPPPFIFTLSLPQDVRASSIHRRSELWLLSRQLTDGINCTKK